MHAARAGGHPVLGPVVEAVEVGPAGAVVGAQAAHHALLVVPYWACRGARVDREAGEGRTDGGLDALALLAKALGSVAAAHCWHIELALGVTARPAALGTLGKLAADTARAAVVASLGCLDLAIAARRPGDAQPGLAQPDLAASLAHRARR